MIDGINIFKVPLTLSKIYFESLTLTNNLFKNGASLIDDEIIAFVPSNDAQDDLPK